METSGALIELKLLAARQLQMTESVFFRPSVVCVRGLFEAARIVFVSDESTSWPRELGASEKSQLKHTTSLSSSSAVRLIYNARC